MPRVLHLYNVFGAATERAWLDYPLALEGRGWDPIFACETIAPESPAVSPQPIVLPRVNVESTSDVDGQMEEVSRAPLDPAMARLLETGAPAITHGHFGPRLLHGSRLLVRGVPLVVSLYGYDASRLLRDEAWMARCRWVARRGAVLAVLSEAMRRRLLDGGVPRERVRVVHLGIDTSRWRFDPAPAPEKARFVFVGRLTPKKAPTDAVAAIALLEQAHAVEAALEIVGSGPMKEQVRAKIAELGLGGRVALHGELARERVAELMRGATALVLPSVVAPDGDREGTPIVLMEAQALGIPCITTAHAGNAEVLPPEGQRFVVPEHDVEALARAMHAMISLGRSEYRDLQDRGRAWIETHFDLDRTVDAYASLYEVLLGDVRV